MPALHRVGVMLYFVSCWTGVEEKAGREAGVLSLLLHAVLALLPASRAGFSFHSPECLEGGLGSQSPLTSTKDG